MEEAIHLGEEQGGANAGVLAIGSLPPHDGVRHDLDALAVVDQVRDDQKRLTRRRLIEGALAAFERKGYAATTIDDIVAEANASRATFYLHFKSKADIVLVMAERLGRRWLELYLELTSSGRLSREQLRTWLDAMVDNYEFNRTSLDALGQAIAIEPAVAEVRSDRPFPFWLVSSGIGAQRYRSTPFSRHARRSLDRLSCAWILWQSDGQRVEERESELKIKAALSNCAAAPFEITEVELDEPRADEVLVRLTAAGVCHTDLTMKAVWPAELSPVVLGHEGAGVVEAIGAQVTGVRSGDHVLLSYRSCRSCAECAAGHPTYCREFLTLNASGARPDGSTTMHQDGSPVYGSFFGQSSFASHALVYESNLVVVGDHVDLSVAAPLGCGVQTGAGAVLNVLRPGGDASLVLFGVGAVGLSAAMAAAATGIATIIAIDHVAGRRQLAAELGATATIDPAVDDVVDAIRQLTGTGATHALDTTASGAVINQAIDALGPLGTLALVGVGTPEVEINVQAVIGGGKTIRGIIEGDAVPQTFLPQLLDLHAQGRLPIEKLIRTYDFDDIETAVADAASGSTIKPVLVF